MANTYTQIYVHYVLTVQFRREAILEEFRQEVEKYICGIATNLKQKVYAIYCMPEHTHILISRKPNISDSDLMRIIKSNSSKYINEQFDLPREFRWQEGFGAFSVSPHALDSRIKYILGQKEHHKKETHEEEHVRLLKEHHIDFKPQYLFDNENEENSTQ
jgi:putative transposase